MKAVTTKPGASLKATTTTQPTTTVEVDAVVPLAGTDEVRLATIGMGDGGKDGIDVSEHLRSAPAQMGEGAFVEDDASSVGIDRFA